MKKEILADKIESVNELKGFTLYQNSVHEKNKELYGIVRKGIDKFLLIFSENDNLPKDDFSGELISTDSGQFLKCTLTHENAEKLRELFDFTSAQLIGKTDSYGFGDRLGNAGPAHLRAVNKTEFQPILAQQSIRELERTKRTPQEVMDAASWAVFQEGYHAGFGADADHLKTTDDVDYMMKAGFTMFTIDPSDYVVNEASQLSETELKQSFEALPWNDLETDAENLINRYSKNEIQLDTGYTISFSQTDILQGMVKYGRVITHAKMMAEYIQREYPNQPSELELSVDETEVPTSLFEHYLIASELDRLGVELVSLAPRFCGDFEKGVDFKGDLNQFKEEYIQHLAIARKFGGYKLSVHSGSDKFSVYEVIGSIDEGAVHVKTAGTSYLEALRTIATCNPGLFSKIMKFSIQRFEEDKKTYHISAELEQVTNPDDKKDDELPDYLDDDDARQVLHVTYGSVLSGEIEEAAGFRDEIWETLENNEVIHYQFLQSHFEKHLNPFKK